MNPDSSNAATDVAPPKAINEVEMDAATSATFDVWSQNARDFYKGTKKLIENLDDHATLIMTDIFGTDVASAHSRKLEEEAAKEITAGHVQAALHFKRRDLNFSRSSLGEFDPYTQQHNFDLDGAYGGIDPKQLEAQLSSREIERTDALIKTIMHR